MGVQDIKTEIQFGIQFSLDRELVEQATMRMVEYEQDKRAMDLGLKIAEEKGWQKIDMPFSDSHDIYNLKVYVFTPSELRDYMNAKFKARLRDMALSETYLSDEQRIALMIQSERF